LQEGTSKNQDRKKILVEFVDLMAKRAESSRVGKRRLLLATPLLEICFLNQRGRFDLSDKEGPREIFLYLVGSPALDYLLKKGLFSLSISDPELGVPFGPRHLMHEAEPLMHPFEEGIKGSTTGGRGSRSSRYGGLLVTGRGESQHQGDQGAFHRFTPPPNHFPSVFY